MDPWTVLQTLILIALTSFLFYRYNLRNRHFWKERGIPFIPQKFLFGNFDVFSSFAKRQHLFDDENYQKYGPIFGGFEGSRPILFIAQPELIKDVAIKDFSAFSSRRLLPYQDDLLTSMLGGAEGDVWKRLRSLMSPAFSSGKMRTMSKLIDECAKSTAVNLRIACSRESVDMKKIFGAFTMDTIASTVFGTKIDSHNDPNNPFVKHASQVFSKNFNLRFLIVFMFPFLGKYVGIRFLPSDVQAFFTEVTNKIIRERNAKKENNKRVDFLQLMLEANKLENSGKGLSEKEILANCILFFIAGYDSTSSSLCFNLYNLALNKKHQDRLAAEIAAVLKETNGDLDYDIIKRMPFLDAVVNETLRLFPPGTRFERRSVEDYTFTNPHFSIPKGTNVAIPVYAIHKDPQYFSEPESFNPERFLPDNKQLMDPSAYMPFGAGPRSCIAMRFALLEVKMCLARIIPDFRFTVSQKTKVPPEFFTALEVLTPKDMFLKVHLRE